MEQIFVKCMQLFACPATWGAQSGRPISGAQERNERDHGVTGTGSLLTQPWASSVQRRLGADGSPQRRRRRRGGKKKKNCGILRSHLYVCHSPDTNLFRTDGLSVSSFFRIYYFHNPVSAVASG